MQYQHGDDGGAADRLALMVAGGEVRMTPAQLLAMFDREDTVDARGDIEDELFYSGLRTRPPLEGAKPGERLKVLSLDQPAADHMLRNGIIWSILVPIVGAILAICLFARERVGQGFAVLATAVLVVLVYFYAFGAFDRQLSGIGLNVHECARNGLGQTYCGKELDEVRARISSIKQSSEEADSKAKEEGEELERRSREEETKAQEDLKREEAKSQEELSRAEAKSQEELRREEAKSQAELREAEQEVQ
jgi:Skp family chaperone for outer membrane proteins